MDDVGIEDVVPVDDDVGVVGVVGVAVLVLVDDDDDDDGMDRSC